MSTLTAPIVEYRSEKHPNADALELAIVNDWRVACQIGSFSQGQDVAFIPPDSVLPDDLIEEMGLEGRLAGAKKNRVKPIRLRQVLSQGLIYAGPRIDGLGVGDNAVEALGLTKFKPVVPTHMKGQLYPGPKINFDIENIKNWPDVLQEGEEVVITEKLHGTFCCFGVIETRVGALYDGDETSLDFVVASKGVLGKGLRFKLDVSENDNNLYVQVFKKYRENLIRGARDARFRALFAKALLHESLASVYFMGEIVGPKVQDLNYELDAPEFFLFDVRVPSKSYPTYENDRFFRNVVYHMGGVKSVPVLYRGPWSKELLSHTDGPSTIANHMREGIVVKPEVPRYDDNLGGRVVLKSVSETYLTRRGTTTEYN